MSGSASAGPLIIFICGQTTREVIILDYQDLYDVLKDVPGAQEFFDKLPDNIKEKIKSQPYNIISFDVLKNSAKSFARIG
jgi:hypothetical protein